MKKSLTLFVAAAIALFGALPAGAQEAPVESENELSIGFNEETGELNFGFGQDLECFAPETITDEDVVDEVVVDDDAVSFDDDDASSDDDAVSSDDDDDASSDDDAVSSDDDDDDDASSDDAAVDAEEEPLTISECNIIDATGPNGQINHGSVVSSFVHALKASDYDGKIGHLVRQIAKSDFGKGEKEADAELSGDTKQGKKDKNKGKPADAGSKGNGKGNGKNK